MNAPDRLQIPTIGSACVFDRKCEKRDDAAWVEARRSDPRSRFLLLVDLKVAIDSNTERTDTALRWLSLDEVTGLGADPSEFVLLGCDGEDRTYFAAGIAAPSISEDALKPLVDLRSLAVQGALDPDSLAIAGAARSVLGWRDLHRCCGRCGGRTKPRDAGWRRQCWACGQSYFPRSDPAVIMVVTDGERCLLGHEHRFIENFYSVLAGFVEPGEDIENAVRREIREEAGLEVGEVAYLGSQPWPFPHSLMIGCWAEARTTELSIDRSELVDARWVTRAEAGRMLRGEHEEGISVPGPHSIAHALILSFAESGT
ncbi:MAG: NAD(+) diphosphatase [Methyloligellaceae bacterium]